jgi:hypothetical protein
MSDTNMKKILKEVGEFLFISYVGGCALFVTVLAYLLILEHYGI